MCNCDINVGEQRLLSFQLQLAGWTAEQEGSYLITLPNGFRMVSLVRSNGEEAEVSFAIPSTKEQAAINNGMNFADGPEQVDITFKMASTVTLETPWVGGYLLIERGSVPTISLFSPIAIVPSP